MWKQVTGGQQIAVIFAQLRKQQEHMNKVKMWISNNFVAELGPGQPVTGADYVPRPQVAGRMRGRFKNQAGMCMGVLPMGHDPFGDMVPFGQSISNNPRATGAEGYAVGHPPLMEDETVRGADAAAWVDKALTATGPADARDEGVGGHGGTKRSVGGYWRERHARRRRLLSLDTNMNLLKGPEAATDTDEWGDVVDLGGRGGGVEADDAFDTPDAALSDVPTSSPEGSGGVGTAASPRFVRVVTSHKQALRLSVESGGSNAAAWQKKSSLMARKASNRKSKAGISPTPVTTTTTTTSTTTTTVPMLVTDDVHASPCGEVNVGLTADQQWDFDVGTGQIQSEEGSQWCLFVDEGPQPKIVERIPGNDIPPPGFDLPSMSATGATGTRGFAQGHRGSGLGGAPQRGPDAEQMLGSAVLLPGLALNTMNNVNSMPRFAQAAERSQWGKKAPMRTQPNDGPGTVAPKHVVTRKKRKPPTVSLARCEDIQQLKKEWTYNEKTKQFFSRIGLCLDVLDGPGPANKGRDGELRLTRCKDDELGQMWTIQPPQAEKMPNRDDGAANLARTVVTMNTKIEGLSAKDMDTEGGKALLQKALGKQLGMRAKDIILKDIIPVEGPEDPAGGEAGGEVGGEAGGEAGGAAAAGSSKKTAGGRSMRFARYTEGKVRPRAPGVTNPAVTIDYEAYSAEPEKADKLIKSLARKSPDMKDALRVLQTDPKFSAKITGVALVPPLPAKRTIEMNVAIKGTLVFNGTTSTNFLPYIQAGVARAASTLLDIDPKLFETLDPEDMPGMGATTMEFVIYPSSPNQVRQMCHLPCCVCVWETKW